MLGPLNRMRFRGWDGISDTLLDWLRIGHAPVEEQDGRARHPLSGLPRRVAIVALVAVAALAAWAYATRGPQVSVTAARMGAAAEVIYATGVVEPTSWAKVSAPSRRRIVEICNCEGQAVKTGDILARLDDAEERAILAQLEVRLERLNEDAERTEALVKRNAAPRATLDEKITQVREQEARVAAQKVRIAELQLRSPVDGVVLRRDGEVGEIASIAAGDALLWVGQPRPLRIVAEVNEDDILRIAPGQSVLLRHEGHTGAPLTATVASITPKGDPDSKTFRVYMSLPDDTPLKIGMSVEANVIVAEAQNAVLIPAEALSGDVVQMVADGKVRERVVKTGVRGTTMVEIRSGLAAGDSVISPFDPKLTEGQTVRPLASASR